jgi:hypothetical protein
VPAKAFTLTFLGPAGSYRVAYDPEIGSFLFVTLASSHTAQRWDILVDEIDDHGHPVLRGLAYIDDVYWFDLSLGPDKKIDYWGDKVLVRTDRPRSTFD